MLEIHKKRWPVPAMYSFLLLVILISNIDAFNLENRLPIVKYGDFNTYFGYSVAGHVVGERDDAQKTNW